MGIVGRWQVGILSLLVLVSTPRVDGQGARANAKAPLKIGYGTFPPYFVMPKGAPPTGFAVEVVREAARRLRMNVEWHRYKESTDKALIAGEIDLFPLLAIIPSREGKMEFSDPWWENTLVVVSRQEGAIRTASDTEGKRITLIHASFGLQRMQALFPKAVPVPEKEYEKVVQNVCTGNADGAIIETRLASALTLLPQCSNVELTMAWFPELNLTYAVGARLGLKAEADRLQREIVRMAQDGTMTRIGEPWGVQVTNQRRLLESLVEGRVREQRWRDAMWGVGGLLILALVQGYRLRQARLAAESARRKAEEALAARSEFVANISHEIRTPLNGLLGMTQILRDTPLDASQRECAEILDSSGQTLLALIDELLDFSKLEAGKLHVESLPFAPARVVTELTSLFAARASERGVLLAPDLHEDLPAAVQGDPIRLRQILGNLVGNAVKFTAKGTIIVRAKAAPAEGAGHRLRFEVADTGCGIEPAMAERIFEPFTQADGSTSRRHGGTGLGLAICRNLTALLGGEIGIDSTPGKGSTFWVELPFGIAEGEVAESGPETMTEEMLSLHVLVAEDNQVNQHVLAAHLRKLGCTWTMTANGREAVEAARAHRFDAILMDGQMPEVDGFAAAQQVRLLTGAAGKVPIIGVTACAFEEDKRRCIDSGMQSVLTKPFTTRELREALQGVLTAS